jgi:hypothetical protein
MSMFVPVSTGCAAMAGAFHVSRGSLGLRARAEAK